MKNWQQQVADVKKHGTVKAHAYVKGRKLTSLQTLRMNGEVVSLPDQLFRALRGAWSAIDNPSSVITDDEAGAVFEQYADCFSGVPWPEHEISVCGCDQSNC